MNQFEQRMSALKAQSVSARQQIQQECDTWFAEINKQIATESDTERRCELRTHKNRIYRMTRRSLYYERRAYNAIRETIAREYRQHLEQHPSGNALRAQRLPSKD